VCGVVIVTIIIIIIIIVTIILIITKMAIIILVVIIIIIIIAVSKQILAMHENSQNHARALHPTGRIRNFGIRNRAPKTQMSFKYLKVKNKNKNKTPANPI